MMYSMIYVLFLFGGILALPSIEEYESSHHSNGCLLKGGSCIPRQICRGRAAIAFSDACDGPEDDDVVCCIETHIPLLALRTSIDRSKYVLPDSKKVVMDRSHPSADFDNVCQLRGGSCIPREVCPRTMSSYEFCDSEELICCIERKIPRSAPISKSEAYLQVLRAIEAQNTEEGMKK